MIVGEYNGRNQATVPLLLRGPDGRQEELDVVIDTGFTGFLMLPHRIVRELSLAPLEQAEVVLADGSYVWLTRYEVGVFWEDEVTVVAYASDGDPLVGIKLLRESLVTLELTQGGSITIEPL